MTDNIIAFPGGQKGRAKPADPAHAVVSDADLARAQQAMKALSEDQQKALGLIASGLPFVLVAIKPTGSGADFFTAVHGERQVLADAAPHLDGVVQRALQRKGVGG